MQSLQKTQGYFLQGLLKTQGGFAQNDLFAYGRPEVIVSKASWV